MLPAAPTKPPTVTPSKPSRDGLDGVTVGGLVGAAGNTGVFNYVNTIAGITLNAAARKGSGAANSDGSSSGAGGSAMDFALTGTGDMIGVDGLSR